MSTEEKDIELLEQVELRLALASTDEQIAQLTSAFLVPLINKLDTPHARVRDKVLAVLSHVNSRIKSKAATAAVPVKKIVESVLHDPTATSQRHNAALISSLALVYIEMGLPGMPATERVQTVLPALLRGFATRPKQQWPLLMHLINGVPNASFSCLPDNASNRVHMQILPLIPVPANSETTAVISQTVLQHSQDVATVLEQAILFVLYHIVDAHTLAKKPAGGDAMDVDSVSSPTTPMQVDPTIPPCMTAEQVALVSCGGKFKPSFEELRKLKTSILHFVVHYLPDMLVPTTSPLGASSSTAKQGTELLPALRLPKFLILQMAACDRNSALADLAETGLRKFGLKPSLEDPVLVGRLFGYYLGEARAGQSVRKPADVLIKTRILHLLTKSALAANTFPQAIQVTFDAIHGEGSNNKLRLAGMSLAQWIARMCAPEKLQPFAPVLLSGMLNALKARPATASDNESETIRGFAYEVAGLILRKAPSLADLDTLRTMFEAIGQESPNVRISVQEGLSAMLPVYRDREPSEELQKLLEEHMNAVQTAEHQARYMALKYNNATMPFSSAVRCYHNLLLSSDAKLEIREESSQGLSLKGRSAAQVPSASQVVRLLLDRPREARGGRTIRNMATESAQTAVLFIRSLFVALADESVLTRMAAGDHVDVDAELANASVSQNLADWLARAVSASDDSAHAQDVTAYTELLSLCLCSPEANDPVLQVTSAQCLEELLLLAPSSAVERVAGALPQLQSLLLSSSTKPEARKSVALCMALIILQSDIDVSKQTLELCLKKLQSPASASPDELCGSILLLGFLTGRAFCASSSAIHQWATANRQAIETGLTGQLDNSSYVVAEAAVCGVSEVGLYAKLDGSVIVFDKLAALAKSTKNSKASEQALHAVGYLSVGNPDVADKTVGLLFELIPLNKTVEVLFTAGEALANACAGWASAGLSRYRASTPVSTDRSPDVLEKALSRCFDELATGKPNARKLVCVYLTSTLKLCGSHPVVTASLKRIHNSLLSLLADKDELVQEVASKGMTFIYDLGDKSLKDDLVWSLVETLGEGQKKSLSQNVRPETALFDNLGRSPEGTNLTTYQSILSLASEMNQPDLVYKFMQLASHNALWQSRIGGAFGVSALLTRANKDLQPYLKGLIPKLYRFQFDPTPQVSQAMLRIWKSLVSDPQKTIDECFDAIAADLLANLTSRQWRNREASCTALNDLLQRRTLGQLLSNGVLTELWHLAFRTLDDIKESVRAAALTTCKTFANLTVRYVDPATVTPAEGEKVLSIVVPFLLHKGLASSAEDVRRFSLNTLVQLCEKSGSLLSKHVAEIALVLLECLSSMEPQAMTPGSDYLSFHIEKYDMTQDQLEHARLASARTSPIMQALESLVDNLTAESMEPLVANVVNVIRRGVGMPTRAGCARLVCSICYKKPVLVKPYADEILKALSGAVNDRSPAVRASMATAAGYTAKCASLDFVTKFATHCKKLYLDNSDPDLKSGAPITFTELSRHALDVVKSIESAVLPLTYFGCYDTDESIAKIWKTCWDLNTSQSTAPLRLYTREIIELVLASLSSAKWEVKQQAARTVSELCKALDQKYMEVHLPAVTSALREALGKGLWEGKQVVLSTLIGCCVAYPEYFCDHVDTLDDIVQILSREIQRSDVAYKRSVIDALCTLLAAVPARAQLNTYEVFAAELWSLAAPDSSDKQAMDVDDDDQRARPMRHMLKASAFKAIASTWPSDATQTQEAHYKTVLSKMVDSIPSNVWIVQQEIVDGLTEVLRKLHWGQTVLSSVDSQALLGSVIAQVAETGEKMKYTSLRKSCIKCLDVIAERVNESATLHQQLSTSVASLIAHEKDDALLADLQKLKHKINGTLSSSSSSS
ncbi:proteasome component M29 [Sorochytrium milnesiophthora]